MASVNSRVEFADHRLKGDWTMADTLAAVALLRKKMLIDGEWVDAQSGTVLQVENPAHKLIIAEVPRGGAEDVDRAVKAALGAFTDWRRVPPRERGKILCCIGDAIDAQSEDIARMIASETGNALRTQARPGQRSRVPRRCFATSPGWHPNSRVRRSR
jgi:delta 1-pyrroline-5-carboxylate dehydrogenase